jgi:hypothetical protein
MMVSLIQATTALIPATHNSLMLTMMEQGTYVIGIPDAVAAVRHSVNKNAD